MQFESSRQILYVYIYVSAKSGNVSIMPLVHTLLTRNAISYCCDYMFITEACVCVCVCVCACRFCVVIGMDSGYILSRVSCACN